MSIRDDYPAMTTLADACAERVDEACPEAVRAWRELARLRQWRDDALNELSEWDTVHAEVAGASAHLGRTKAENVRREMHRLRGQCEVWKNGVADVVEPWGYDREAACGPADLLPGLTELARRLRECVEARRHLYAQVVDSTARQQLGAPPTVRGRVYDRAGNCLDPGCSGTPTSPCDHDGVSSRHRVIPQAGSNVCVCGEWFDAEIHQVPSLAPDGVDRRPCVCGHPQAEGVLHRTDGPCFHVARSETGTDDSEVTP